MPAADAVVLIHGTRTSHSQWDPQVPSLRAAGYRVATPDLPGHGTHLTEPFTVEAALAGIRDAVRAQQGRAVHLVGSSLGGMLAIRAVAQAQLDPQLAPAIRSLTVIGSAVQPTPLTARLYAQLMLAADPSPALAHAAEDRQRMWLLSLLLGRPGARAYLRGGRPGPEVLRPAMASVAAIDLRGALARIPVPVTILSPRFDQLRLQERSFAAAAPQGRLIDLPYGTHSVNLAAAHRFTPELLRILARHRTGTPAPRHTSKGGPA